MFILTGCEEENPLSAVEGNHGKVVLTIDGANTPASVVAVEATFERGGYESIIGQMDRLNNSTAEVTLEDIAVGEWNLQVDTKN